MSLSATFCVVVLLLLQAILLVRQRRCLQAIQQFVRFCSEQDWTIVFWQVRDTTAEFYRRAGFRLLKIGEDAVVNPQDFTLKGGSMANVRSSAKRAERDGVHVIFYYGKVTNVHYISQMEQISRAWLAHKSGSEMGFSMGHFDAHGNTEQLYVLAVDTTNKVHAFVSFVPIYGRRGWGLDLMRRSENCAPGTMELLLAHCLEEMKRTGIHMVSLGLAPLSNANGESATFLDNSLDFLTDRFGNPEKNQSLFNFKKKFQPTWESRYLVYSDALNLPKIGWALYNAHREDATLLKSNPQWVCELAEKPSGKSSASGQKAESCASLGFANNNLQSRRQSRRDSALRLSNVITLSVWLQLPYNKGYITTKVYEEAC